MNIKYFIIKGKKKYSSIYIRFWDSKRIDQKTKTGFYVNYKEWDESKQRVKITLSTTDADFINSKLNKLETYIVNRYNRDYNSSNAISKKWLKEAINAFFNRSEANETHKTYFLDWIDNYIDDLPKQLHNGKPLSNNTIKNYKSAQAKIKAFEKYKNIRYRHEDIDLNFHREFVHYCKTIENLNNNSVGVLIGKIKTFCKNIELQELPVNPIYKHKNFSAPKNETYDIYLNEAEITQIIEHDFQNNERLDNARDLFIIGLRTGLRVSDISKLKEKNLLDNIINITTTKTNQNLNIPVHPQVSKILKKRNGKLPRIISDQKFNKYIKEVSKKAGIKTKVFGSKRDDKTNRKKEGYYDKWELISSHTCRRSFASNLFLQGIDTRLIMSATGHKSEKQLLSYVKATQQEKNEVISKLWEIQSKKQ